MRVDTGAHGGAADRQVLGDSDQRPFGPNDTIARLCRVTGELLAEADRCCVHQVRAAVQSVVKEEQRKAWEQLGVENYTLVDPIFDDTGLDIDMDDRLIYEGQEALREACEDQGLTLGDVDLSVIIKWVLARVEARKAKLEDLDREESDARQYEESYRQHIAYSRLRSRLVLRE